MSDLNKKSPAIKLIEWAFLCSSAKLREDGGWDITNLNDTFERLGVRTLFLVFRVNPDLHLGSVDQPATQTAYAINSVFALNLIIESEAKKDVEAQTLELLVGPKTFAIPIGESLHEPGNYTVKIFVDGALQHSLDLLVL